MHFFYTFINLLLQALTFAILARVIISWLPMNPGNPIVVILVQITEPILAPLRRIIPRIGMFDLSPMIAILVLQVITWTLTIYAPK